VAQEFSFDVVSKVDLQEVSNAVQQASKEIATRFDFRGSKSKIEWNDKELQLTLTSDDEHKLKSVVDILETRLVKRGIVPKSLDFQKVEPAATLFAVPTDYTVEAGPAAAPQDSP